MAPRYFHLAFDQAFRNSGWALLEWVTSDKKAVYIESGVFSPKVKVGFGGDTIAFLEHMAFIKEKIKQVKDIGTLRSIACEGVAIGAVGQAAARGGVFGIYSVFASQSADTIIISPKTMKAYITGSGSAEKEEIEHIVCEKYGIKREFKTKKDHEMFLNETDAVALAEIGLYAWRVINYGIKIVEKEVEPHQAGILWSESISKPATKTRPSKMRGICNRIDEFYIFNRGKA
jgi:Holliday junction resolvasome RuvABC endonuclease subunit